MNSYKSEFLETALRAAVLAGDFIVKNLGRISEDDIETKQASDFVTRIDKESEHLILNTIKRKFPGHHFLAEESFEEIETTGYLWIIDPLDGTTNFIHQYPVFSVSIALEYNKEIILGVVFDPLRKEMFTAEKGRGALLNGKQIKVSSISDFRNSLVATGFPFRKKELIDPYLKLFRNIFFMVSDIRRAGSAALDLAHLASGRCDCFFEIGLSPWDMAAGSILIKEAGGIVTDFGGGADYLKTGNIVSGTPALHAGIFKEVKRIFQGIMDK
ncbi:MAG TPA: inositol monophosphatase [Nitrospirae bacterium]|nr:inositol-1-monophosphatase [bacterium BMS3Abin06]HDH12511.1 inositol monophosphatase [Nitrospirota bacterium]HDZ00670.1 inositol monophosphatase [Nitrospirota bacterium]